MWALQNITVRLPLQYKTPVEIALPEGAAILNIQMAEKEQCRLTIWGSDVPKDVCPRKFWFLGEGHKLSNDVSGRLQYIGADSDRKIHLFEERL